MKRRRLIQSLSKDRPDRPRSPAPILPAEGRPGPLGDGPELALLTMIAIAALALIVRGFCS